MMLLLLGCPAPPPEEVDVCSGTFEADPVDDAVRTTDVWIEDAAFRIHAQLLWPTGAEEGDRWPIVVVVHGGWEQSGTPVGRRTARVDSTAGLVAIHVDLPGQGDSTGINDRRGAESRAALALVLRWAAGETDDWLGCTPRSRTVFADHDDIYLLGGSNGGNLATAVLADASVELPDLHGLVLWEDPPGSQFTNVDLGRTPTVYEPGSCVWDAVEGLSCPWPAELLRWAEGDGLVEPCFDVDGDDTCSNRDVPIHSTEDPVTGLAMLTPGIIAALDAAGAPVEGYADADTAAAWWKDRDTGQHVAPLVARFPDLPVMLVASEQDHIQTLVDHPHIHGLGQGFQEAGVAWLRLNPGRRWLAQEGENLPDLPLSLAGDDARLLTEDEEEPLAGVLAAAVEEMSARWQTGDWRTP